MFVATVSLIIYLVASTLSFVFPKNNLRKSSVDEMEFSFRRLKRNENSEFDDYKMKFKAFGKYYEGKLERPPRSIFAENFKYLVLGDETPEKEITIREATPTLQELTEINDRHFISAELFSALSLQTDAHQIRKIRGTFGDIMINTLYQPGISKEKKRKASLNELANDSNNEMKIVVTKRDDAHFSAHPTKDYLDSSIPSYLQNSTLRRRRKLGPAATKNVAEIEPELLVVVDNEKFNGFKGDTKDILDYVGVFLHGVNNIYAPLKSPKIKFRLTAVTSMSTPGAQPFIETLKTSLGTIPDADQLLKDFGSWVYSNKDKLPKHDLALLLSGLDIHSLQGGKAAAGSSNRGQVCYVSDADKRSYAVSVAEDIGSNFAGVFIASHELAHNLGAPHDGEPGAEKCPWKDGYLMSYLGWGTPNKLVFSKCSIKLINEHISSASAHCLHSIQNKDFVPIPKEVPERNRP